jgi:hypothetical protein
MFTKFLAAITTLLTTDYRNFDAHQYFDELRTISTILQRILPIDDTQ